MHPETVDDPWLLFDAWYREAVEQHLPLPEAFTLATVSEQGRASARVVLYKPEAGPGLRFFTNYSSRKGKELSRVPFAVAVFHWASLARQVRIEGGVECLSSQESDAYFATRPRESQIGAWASPQSQPLKSREELEQRMREVRDRYLEGAVPRPPHWGGYQLAPESFEFWTGSAHRLNERWLFRRETAGWVRSLLAP